MRPRLFFVAGAVGLAVHLRAPAPVPAEPLQRRTISVRLFRVQSPPAGGWTISRDERLSRVEFMRAPLSQHQRTTTIRVEVIPVLEARPPVPYVERATMLREEFAAEGRRRAMDTGKKTGPMIQADSTIGGWRVYSIAYSLRPRSTRDSAGEETASYLLFSPDYARTGRVYHFRARQWYARASDSAPGELRSVFDVIASFEPVHAPAISHDDAGAASSSVVWGRRGSSVRSP